MSAETMITIDGNEAAASVAYRLAEVAALYPITPASPMGEHCDTWAARKRPNVWGQVPAVVEMQSEAGAAGTVHGALQGGALATTFTASQGLLLMIPNMYKIAGELTPFVMHVAARTVATHALSIFGDHSDVMACRGTGFAMLCSGSVQEAGDLACIAQMATLETRVPFLHFFDGFRTSHEIAKVAPLSDDDLRALVDEELVRAHRTRALTPDRPVVRGTAQNPDTFFQAREAANGFYDACPDAVAGAMERFAAQTGRRYRIFEYEGHPEAERVAVVLGSAGATLGETAAWLNERGERVGVLHVRLYRPWSERAFLDALPPSVRSVAVLDRTKEPGATGEPLLLDVLATVHDAAADGAFAGGAPRVVGGRYGLSSKEFTPAMAKAVFDELGRDAPRRRFTVGIVDDVTHLSLDVDPAFDIEPDDVVRAVFHGLGSDGTVGANKNSIRIIGEAPDRYAQAYFVYDSKKAGARTVSHLRFGPRPLRAPYLIRQASFLACHQWRFLDLLDLLETAKPGATVLLNSPHAPERVWDELPREAQETLVRKRPRLFAIDADAVAAEAGLGGRINTVMQTCFFALSGVVPADDAIARIKAFIEKTYARKGEEVVTRNFAAVDAALARLHEIEVPAEPTADRRRPPPVPTEAPDFVRRVTGAMTEGHGDLLPVSAFPPDGTWPTGTARWEKRNLAREIPLWSPDVCIQCNKCVLVCPHAAIRAKVYEPAALGEAPDGFLSSDYRGPDFEGTKYTIQVAPEDCTGCTMCVRVCPARDKAEPRRKAINMETQLPVRERERERYSFFLDLPEPDRTAIRRLDVKGTQFMEPLFEYSGACAGCGETPYIKLLTQLYGDRAVIANATGCSSIYGGNLPTTPYATNRDGRGPAWSNSLFEDNAEFGLGIRIAIERLRDRARGLLRALAPRVGDDLATTLLEADEHGEQAVHDQRERVAALRAKLRGIDAPEARALEELADYLVRKSVWLVGGDGWAYDIGYGGLDHVLSTTHDVNVLVLDTEVYSNTGGQASKATPLGASAKFASMGKPTGKKDLGLMAMNYGHVYVASIAFGARDAHTVQAFVEADSYEGPSLLIAYSHCVAHGYDMAFGPDQQKRAVDSGVWPLFRFDPRRLEAGEHALVVDAKGGKTPVRDYMSNETRFRILEHMDPERFRDFARRSQVAAERRVALYRHLAALQYPAGGGTNGGGTNGGGE